jgi:hypothetical protein
MDESRFMSKPWQSARIKAEDDRAVDLLQKLDLSDVLKVGLMAL